jgi:hypothetical protein
VGYYTALLPWLHLLLMMFPFRPNFILLPSSAFSIPFRWMESFARIFFWTIFILLRGLDILLSSLTTLIYKTPEAAPAPAPAAPFQT